MRFNAVLTLAAGSLLRRAPTNAIAFAAPRSVNASVVLAGLDRGPCASEVDVVFVIDASGAVDDEGLLNQQGLAAQLAKNLGGGPARLGVVAYADMGVIVSEMSSDAAAIIAALAAMKRPSGHTRNAADALAKAGYLLMSGGRQSASSMILMVLAGTPKDIGGMAHMAEQTKQQARLMLMPVGYSSLLAERAQEWCSWPHEHNVFPYASFQGFPALVQKFVPEFCSRLHGVAPPPGGAPPGGPPPGGRFQAPPGASSPPPGGR